VRTYSQSMDLTNLKCLETSLKVFNCIEIEEFTLVESCPLSIAHCSWTDNTVSFHVYQNVWVDPLRHTVRHTRYRIDVFPNLPKASLLLLLPTRHSLWQLSCPLLLHFIGLQCYPHAGNSMALIFDGLSSTPIAPHRQPTIFQNNNNNQVQNWCVHWRTSYNL